MRLLKSTSASACVALSTSASESLILSSRTTTVPSVVIHRSAAHYLVRPAHDQIPIGKMGSAEGWTFVSAEVITAQKAVHLERTGSIHACLEQTGIHHVLMQGMAPVHAYKMSRADLRPYTPAEIPPSTSYSGAPSAPIASALQECRAAIR